MASCSPSICTHGNAAPRWLGARGHHTARGDTPPHFTSGAGGGYTPRASEVARCANPPCLARARPVGARSNATGARPALFGSSPSQWLTRGPHLVAPCPASCLPATLGVCSPKPSWTYWTRKRIGISGYWAGPQCGKLGQPTGFCAAGTCCLVGSSRTRISPATNPAFLTTVSSFFS
jgi:hypothetical protein